MWRKILWPGFFYLGVETFSEIKEKVKNKSSSVFCCYKWFFLVFAAAKHEQEQSQGKKRNEKETKEKK